MLLQEGTKESPGVGSLEPKRHWMCSFDIPRSSTRKFFIDNVSKMQLWAVKVSVLIYINANENSPELGCINAILDL